MLLCPWLLSLLYKTLRPVFLRFFFIAFLYVRGFIEPETTLWTSWLEWSAATMPREKKKSTWISNRCFAKKTLKNRCFQREADKSCSPYPDSGLRISILNNPWAIMMLLYATHDLLLHLLLYHQSLHRRHAGEALLSKHKLLLFPLCLLLINFICGLFFYLKRLAVWHFINSISRRKNQGAVYTQSTSIRIASVDVQYFIHV